MIHEKMSKGKKLTGYLAVLGFLLAAVGGIAYYVWWGMNNTPATQIADDQVVPEETTQNTETEVDRFYTKEDQLRILEELDEQSDEVTYTEAEQREILRELEERSDDVPEYTREQQLEILRELDEGSVPLIEVEG